MINVVSDCSDMSRFYFLLGDAPYRMRGKYMDWNIPECIRLDDTRPYSSILRVQWCQPYSIQEKHPSTDGLQITYQLNTYALWHDDVWIFLLSNVHIQHCDINESTRRAMMYYLNPYKHTHVGVEISINSQLWNIVHYYRSLIPADVFLNMETDYVFNWICVSLHKYINLIFLVHLEEKTVIHIFSTKHMYHY